MRYHVPLRIVIHESVNKLVVGVPTITDRVRLCEGGVEEYLENGVSYMSHFFRSYFPFRTTTPSTDSNSKRRVCRGREDAQNGTSIYTPTMKEV